MKKKMEKNIIDFNNVLTISQYFNTKKMIEKLVKNVLL